MDSDVERRLRALVQERVRAQAEEIRFSLLQIQAGNPLGAERSPERRLQRIASKTTMTLRDAEAVSDMIGRAADSIAACKDGGAEAVQGPSIDFVGVDFLTKGRIAANSVGRVVIRTGKARGSGFLVGPGLFLTNHHVIPSALESEQMRVEFDYEAADGGGTLPVTTFQFDPSLCFVTSPIEDLDYTLVALGRRTSGAKDLGSFGYLMLSDAPDKHMLGEIANIIQHPNGELKQVVVRENNLVARDETHQVLHYLADTDKGSSGSPVCNNSWEPIALHHWGGPGLELKGVSGQWLRKDVNEGIRVSAIVRSLRDRMNSLPPQQRGVLTSLFVLWSSGDRGGPVAPQESFTESSATRKIERHDGSTSWIFPIEISVRAPLIDGHRSVRGETRPGQLQPHGEAQSVMQLAELKRSYAESFDDRGGYEPGFIPGFVVPVPSFENVGYALAVNSHAEGDDHPNELRYHHFSVFMNAERRLASVTACNIDGSRGVSINRRDKTATEKATPRDFGVESLGPEASDDFKPDRRILLEEQMARPFYEDQVVPGYAKPDFPGKDASKEQRQRYAAAMSERTARMLQKGHIVLRSDPSWGTVDEARAAEQDTFFYTNAAPQFGFFNQGSRDDKPGSKGKLRWRAVESYILRNAVVMRKRVCVFAGPVFSQDDPPYRFGSQIPMLFWKIAAWADGRALRAVAVKADQRAVFEHMTNGMPEGAESYDALEELSRVSEYLTTIEDIEALTGLDFGEALRHADIRAGDPMPVALAEAEGLPLAGFFDLPTKETGGSMPAGAKSVRKTSSVGAFAKERAAPRKKAVARKPKR